MKKIIVGIGEVLWDVLPEARKIGGAPANFAYHVSQFGLPGCVVSAIGPDRLGREIVGTFDAMKLNHILPVVDFPTGTVQIELDAEGVPEYEITENVAWDNIPFSKELANLAEHTCAVCFGSLAQRSDVSRSTILKFLDAVPDNEDVLKVFDINLRLDYYTEEIIRESLRRCNVLKINEDELAILSRMFGAPDAELKEMCRKLLKDYDLRILILTCGENGSYVFSKDAVSFLPTPSVEVADTVGAGDSFTAAFISNIIKGVPVPDAHRKAVEVAAFVCTRSGAMPELPSSILKK